MAQESKAFCQKKTKIPHNIYLNTSSALWVSIGGAHVGVPSIDSPGPSSGFLVLPYLRHCVRLHSAPPHGPCSRCSIFGWACASTFQTRSMATASGPLLSPVSLLQHQCDSWPTALGLGSWPCFERRDMGAPVVVLRGPDARAPEHLRSTSAVCRNGSTTAASARLVLGCCRPAQGHSGHFTPSPRCSIVDLLGHAQSSPLEDFRVVLRVGHAAA